MGKLFYDSLLPPAHHICMLVHFLMDRFVKGPLYNLIADVDVNIDIDIDIVDDI